MTEKPQALQEMESAIGRLTEAQEALRVSKTQIKEYLSKLRGATQSDEDRLSIARYLLEKYDGCYGITKSSVSRSVLDCSLPEMEKRFGPKAQNCPSCGAILHYQSQKRDIQDSSGFFRKRTVPRGWSCLDCAGVPAWMLKAGKLGDTKTKILRRFSSLPFSLGDYTYAVGVSSMIRIQRISGYGEPDFPGSARENALNLEAHFATGDLGFVTMPKLPKMAPSDYQDYWRVLFHAGNKVISLENMHRINGLPGIEIAPKISGSHEPMVFRFAFGIGVVAPVKPDRIPENSRTFYLQETEWVSSLPDSS